MDATQENPRLDPEHVVAHTAPASHTPYTAMSVQANLMPMRYEICASFCSWITLAGYVVLPNTFTSLKNADSLGNTASGKAIQDAVRNVELLPFAGVLCCAGAAGSCLLWWKWRRNYIWLTSRIFL